MIVNSGPFPNLWTFITERYCGSLLPCVTSKLNPYGALAAHAVRDAQLNQVSVLYDLSDKLDFKRRSRERPSRLEKVFENC